MRLLLPLAAALIVVLSCSSPSAPPDPKTNCDEACGCEIDCGLVGKVCVQADGGFTCTGDGGAP